MKAALWLLLGLALPGQEVPFKALFVATAGPRWLDRAAQVKAESGFRPDATAPDGGMGLAQFMPRTWAFAQVQGWVPRHASPYRPEYALPAQHAYMTWLEARTGARLDPALGAYNAGLGSVRKAQLLAETLRLEGEGAWLTTLSRVTGARNAAITRAYLQRNRRYRAELARQEAS